MAKYISLLGKKTSHATLAKAELIFDAAQQEPAFFGQIWTDLNSEKISPNEAYKKMQRIQTRQNEKVEPQPSTECEHGQIKDLGRIKELEDAVRNNMRHIDC